MTFYLISLSIGHLISFWINKSSRLRTLNEFLKDEIQLKSHSSIIYQPFPGLIYIVKILDFLCTRDGWERDAH